jgi:dolichyl-phosphate beta-glucosyltransferase
MLPSDGVADGKQGQIIRMNNRQKPAVSLVIPVYNETVRLVSGLRHILNYLSAAPFSWEIIIVDDGSTIPVSQVLLQIPLSRLPVHVFRLPHNYGKGKAIASGVARAKGDIIVFCDVDMSVPISKLTCIRNNLKNYPVVISSRRQPLSNIVVHQSLFREGAGRIFTVLSNIFCATDVADVTCGCKGFKKDVAKRLFAKSRINRWVFDAEIIFLARKYGYRIYEMPVDWVNNTGSKVRLRDGIGSLVDLFRIRWYDVRGEYNK